MVDDMDNELGKFAHRQFYGLNPDRILLPWNQLADDAQKGWIEAAKRIGQAYCTDVLAKKFKEHEINPHLNEEIKRLKRKR